MSDYPHSATRTTTVTSVTVSATRPELDFAYIKTLPGILRIVEIVLSFIVFICSVSNYCSAYSNAGWAAFVGFTGFILCILLLVLSIMHVYDAYPQLPWYMAEFIFYAVWTLFFLIAGACLAALSSYHYWCKSATGAGSFFAFVAMVVFGLDAFLKFREWRGRVTLARSGAAGGGPA